MMEAEKMRNMKRIVVAVDEGEESMKALSWCLNNLISQINYAHTNLVLLYVKPPPPVYVTLDPTGYFFAGDEVAAMEKYTCDVASSVLNKAESVCRNFNNSIKVEKKLGSGEAKDVICAAVESLKADILVMGSHDYGFFKRAFLGSVSEHCAKVVKCPVVVVKNQTMKITQI